MRTVGAAIVAAVTSLAACAPRAPGIADPYRVQAYCRPREARITSIRSVLTTASDRLGEAATWSDVDNAVQSGDAAIAYWHDQPLRLPNVAAALGERGDYVRVRAAAIPPAPAGAQLRHIYLDLSDHGRDRWVAMDAYDLQDVCVEGHKQT